jgi:hypothetical protein
MIAVVGLSDLFGEIARNSENVRIRKVTRRVILELSLGFDPMRLNRIKVQLFV